VSILILSLGGGGGNILRSLKALFRRDLLVTQKIDGRYADRLRRAVCTRFLDTNEFSLGDVPREERVMIGARTTGRLGARHNPDVAREALAESHSEVEDLISGHSVVIVIGTGGKGTGAGTMFPITWMARQQRKLVIPIFVRPSFERHEVDKRRFDHALGVVQQFDQARIRLIEILNDLGYAEQHPEPQSVVWEQMNLPIARGLRGLIYVLSDLSQVDPSDLSTLFAGPGRLRIGFAEIDPPPSREPDDDQVEEAVRRCWQNAYYAFSRPVGTSLICIQGEWSNIVDARIKGGLATLAAGELIDNPYNPLYARAPGAPRPWGITALFAEHTGSHPPLSIDWSLERKAAPIRAREVRDDGEVGDEADTPPIAAVSAADPAPAVPAANPPGAVPFHDETARPSFATLREFAVAVNRSDPAAMALASDGVQSDIPVEGGDVRHLLSTPWFPGVVPRLSPPWRERILDALVSSAPLPNHVLTIGKHTVRLSQLNHDQLNDLFARSYVGGTARPDLELLLIVGRLWGPEALGRFQFTGVSETGERSRLSSILHGFRR
jgi:cell division GTPase FtsZ